MNHLRSYKDEEPSSKRRKVAGITIPARFLQADTSNVARSSDCFSGKQFCVFNGAGTLSKHELEKKIVSGGGDIVQNPGKGCVRFETADAYILNYFSARNFLRRRCKRRLKSQEPQTAETMERSSPILGDSLLGCW